MTKRIAFAAAFGVSLIASVPLLAQSQSTHASRMALAVEHDIKCGFPEHPACDDPAFRRTRAQVAVRTDLKCGFQPYAPCGPRHPLQRLAGRDLDLGKYLIERGRLEQRYERGELTLGQYMEATG